MDKTNPEQAMKELITVLHIVSGYTKEWQISTIKGEAPEQYGCDWE